MHRGAHHRFPACRRLAPVALALIFAFPFGTTPAVASDDVPGALTGPEIGAPAPDFSLRTVDGKTVTLQSYRGKTLVLNVWATWCPPCRAEMPGLIAASAEAGEGTAFVGVDTTESADTVRVFAAAKSVPFALAVADASFSKAYDVVGIPATIVIDPAGVVRTRYYDLLSASQLLAFVDAAKHGRSGVVASPLQQRIDSLLADPSIVFTGDSAAVEANAKKAQTAIAGAESLLEQSDAAHGNATDFLRTRVEEATLRDRTIAALVNVGTSVADPSLLPRLRGDGAVDLERWRDALDAYRAVVTLVPSDEGALAGSALAAEHLGQYDVAISAREALVARKPADVGALVELASLRARAGRSDEAYAAFAAATVLAKRQLDASPGKASLVRMLAYVHLCAGRAYAKNGDAPRAREQFERLATWAQKLPANDSRHDMYLEEGQEATAALDLGAAARGASVSLAPWTGAELPGSVPNTLKYRLVVAGTAGRSVALRASEVPRGWVASFCTDRVCAPFAATVVLPGAGVKIVEFQLVPPNGRPAAPHVRVTALDGGSSATAST